MRKLARLTRAGREYEDDQGGESKRRTRAEAGASPALVTRPSDRHQELQYSFVLCVYTDTGYQICRYQVSHHASLHHKGAGDVRKTPSSLKGWLLIVSLLAL